MYSIHPSVSSPLSSLSSVYSLHDRHSKISIDDAISLTTELQGSAIALDFTVQAVELAPDLLIDPITNEAIATPLDDALGKRFTRFGQSNKLNEWGFIFRNEDGSVWQVKRCLGLPQKNGRTGRYLAPKGIGNRAYLPPIPDTILAKICDRHWLELETARQEIKTIGSFWEWVRANPSLPVIVTEGAKKTLAALSQGYIAIGLYGAACGRSQDLAAFLCQGRGIIAAFDSDIKPKAKRTVRQGLAVLGKVCSDAEAVLTVADWHPEQGKGLDDLIVQCGAAALDVAVDNALNHADYRAKQETLNPLRSYQPNLQLEMHRVSDIGISTIPKQGIVVLYSPMGTGKTELITKMLKDSPGAIAPGHSIGLQRGLGQRLGLHYIDDCDSCRGYFIGPDGQPTRHVALCWDSLMKIPLGTFEPGTYDLVLDEADQGLKHLIQGITCGKDGKRPLLLQRAEQLIKNAQRVIGASATLTSNEIDVIATLRNETPWILQNDYQGERFPVTLYRGGTRSDDCGAVLYKTQQALEAGQNVLVMSDQKKLTKAIALMMGVDPSEVLTFHADNSSDEEQRAFALNPDQYLEAHPKRLVCVSPSLTSGVSIEGDHFDLVAGFFYGQSITPADALQQLGRVRKPIERIVYCAQKGRGSDEQWVNACQQSDEKRTGVIKDISGRHIETFDSTHPIAQYSAQAKARRNREMANFGPYLVARLETSGHTVTPGGFQPKASQVYQRLTDATKVVKEQEERDKLLAPIIDHSQANELRLKRALTYTDRCQLDRHEITEFYGIPENDLTLNDIQRDRNGRSRKEIKRLEGLLWAGLSAKRDAAMLEALTKWRVPALGHDLPHNELFTEGAKVLGLLEVVEQCLTADGWDNETDWVVAFAERVRSRQNDIRVLLGFRVHDSMTPCQILGMFLKAHGIKTTSKRTQDEVGKRRRVYRVDRDELSRLRKVLDHHSENHIQQGLQLRPHPITTLLLQGVDATPPNISGADSPLAITGCVQSIRHTKTVQT